MCGRARLSSDVNEIKLVFVMPPQSAYPGHSAQLERGADRPAPDNRRDIRAGERTLDMTR
jgi:hypothetical protein